MPNTNEIVVLMTFFQRGFGLSACDFLHGSLHHYKIKLIHLNLNYVHLCEAYLVVFLNFALFKHHFFLKYQPSATKHQVMGGGWIQARPQRFFPNLPLKTSLKGWHQQWFYCENHETSLPPFVNHLPKYDTTKIEELVEPKMLMVKAMISRVSELKDLGLTGVGVVANWLAHRVIPLKKQVHPAWEYCRVYDPTQELGYNIEVNQLIKIFKEMF
jgi:hypothetical protein